MRYSLWGLLQANKSMQEFQYTCYSLRYSPPPRYSLRYSPPPCPLQPALQPATQLNTA